MTRCAIIALLVLALAVPTSAQRSSRHMPKPGTWGLTFSAGMIGMGGDLTQVQSEYRYKPLGSLLLTHQLRSNFQLGAIVLGGRIGAERAQQRASSYLAAIGLHGEYRLPVGNGMLAPLVFVQTGAIAAAPDHLGALETFADETSVAPFAGMGVGLDFTYLRRFGVRLMGGGMLTGSDKLDGVVSGGKNDGLAWVSLGVAWYLSSR